jgi:hypothetical protein
MLHVLSSVGNFFIFYEEPSVPVQRNKKELSQFWFDT